MYSDKEKQKQAYLNAIELVKILLKYYGWSVDKVKRHYDWTKKHCPAYLIEGKYGYTWNWFKEQCKGKTNTTTKEENTKFKPYLVRCTTDGLNCRKGAGSNYPIERTIDKGTVVTIVEEKINGNTKWGLTKSGYWVALKYTTFVRFI
jgi:N-acetylmuramoyl-L-alanine amidase CwlA